ncbi:MAG TPA: fibronectin type III domain-containing protein [Pyrinomonadaceae bacterium]|nr:fibronectin type III domain-containing protein [Pyrinomonadaceae bacterium]
MSKIKLNLHSLTIPEKIARSQQIVAALTGNPNFTAPHPPLSEVTAAIDELETASNAAQAARQDAKAKTAAQNAKEEALDRIVTQLVGHVESIAGNDEAIILSAGLDVRAAAAPSTATHTAPPTLTATVGDHDGEIDLSWDTVRGARSYVIERSADPPTETSWTHAAVSTRSHITIENLTSGTRYWFRVATITTTGQSGWSNPAMKIAP